MTRRRSSAQVIPFPGLEGARKHTPVTRTDDEPSIVDWPPSELDRLEPSYGDPIVWLEDALVSAKIREISFARGLGQVPPAMLSPEMHNGPLVRFRQIGHRLTLALELLRLGQVEPDDVIPLLPGLRRAWHNLRLLRRTLLEDLGTQARDLVQTDEARGAVGPLDIDRFLQHRSLQRTLEPDPFTPFMAVPGACPLPVPDRPELELMRRRQRRLEQDNLPVNVDMDLAGWLEQLPHEWLEGLARGLDVPMSKCRWEQERAVVSAMLEPGRLELVVLKLSRLERHIVRKVLEAGGMLRYDQLVLRYGADEETAWHWAEEVPTTALERVRRSGLVYAGSCQLGRKASRMAVVPVDLRAPLHDVLSTPGQ